LSFPLFDLTQATGALFQDDFATRENGFVAPTYWGEFATA
jgi:hypothetical protein